MQPRPVEGTPLTEQWSRTEARGLGGAVVQTDTVVYVGAADRHVVAIDLRNGAIRWKTRVLGPIAEGVTADLGRVYSHTERPDGRVYAMEIVGGSRLWDTQVGPASAPPTLVHGTLIVATRRGLVLGLDPKNGKILWRHPLGVSRAPALEGDSGTAVITTMDSLFRLSIASGKVLERRRSPGAMFSAWAEHPIYLIAGTMDSMVIGVPRGGITRVWSVKLDAPVNGTPIIRGDTAYAMTRIGTLYRIPISSAPEAEKLNATNTPFLASPVLVRDWIVAGTADGEVFGFNLDGTIAWRFRLTGPLELSPLVLADGFVAFGGRGDLHRYHL